MAEEIKDEKKELEEEELEKDTDSLETKTEKPKKQKEKKSKEQIKIESLEKEVEKLKLEVANWKNEYLKAHADSQNFQKRINEQAVKDRKYSSQHVVGELVQPIDMLVQIVNMPAPSPEVQNYVIGFQMIANQLSEILKNEGLGPISVKAGDEFNPSVMQAMETSNNAEFGDNVVTKVMQNGYMYKDRVLRPAMVVVNKLEKSKENEEK